MENYTEEDYNMEYRTSKGVRFRALPADPEGTPLSEYRKAEEGEIEAFLDSENEVCLVPGVSMTGKTFLFKKLAKEKGFAFIDVQSLSKRDDEGGTKDEIKDIEKARGGTIFDEGTVAQKSSVKPKFEKLFELAKSKKHKIFLLGGGGNYTTEEQEPMLQESLPLGIKQETILFNLKQLNEQQTKEIIEQRVRRPGTWKKVQRLLSNQQMLEKIVKLFHPYIRFPRSVAMFPWSDCEGLAGEELLVLEEHLLEAGALPAEMQIKYHNKIQNIKKNWGKIGMIIEGKED